MKTEICGNLALIDFEPGAETFRAEFIAGLKQRPKILPCKFFYDERGSKLFDEICELEEYYPTRTETEILQNNIAEIAALCGPRCLLVEPGSGSSGKTRLLLGHLQEPVAYVPIDVSRQHLLRAAEGLNGDYFPLEILPVCADYTQPLRLPRPAMTPARAIVFFPGSTIGNFHPLQAAAFLRRVANWCQPGDGLLIGVDLKKRREIVHRAYNDAKGVTAAFNLNLLRRANDELAANFDLAQFRHRALYNEARGRIEMHLLSSRKQTVTVDGENIGFDQGEHIITEYSYKYCVQDFCALAAAAGWHAQRTWTDQRQWFSVQYLKLAKPRFSAVSNRDA